MQGEVEEERVSDMISYVQLITLVDTAAKTLARHYGD